MCRVTTAMLSLKIPTMDRLPRSAMNLMSPASPVLSSNSGLTEELKKGATVFPSHVRRTFRRRPTDYTGELVRLLDDITTVTHSIAAYVQEGSEVMAYGSTAHETGLSPAVATRRLYKSLCHDGYACLIVDKNVEAPLTMPEEAPQGGYVVMVNSLDLDPLSVEQPICGTVFSVYKRKSLPSLPGRLKDIQQNICDQVAAGYVIYTSATTLHYTLGGDHGVYSFCLHPVATQFFLQPSSAITIPDVFDKVYVDRARLRNDAEVGESLTDLFLTRGPTPVKTYDTGTLVGNFNEIALQGGVLIQFDCHLLCEAGPLALLVEQLGGTAVDAFGKRVLDHSVKDENVHETVTLIAGSATALDEIRARLGRKP